MWQPLLCFTKRGQVKLILCLRRSRRHVSLSRMFSHFEVKFSQEMWHKMGRGRPTLNTMSCSVSFFFLGWGCKVWMAAGRGILRGEGMKQATQGTREGKQAWPPAFFAWRCTCIVQVNSKIKEIATWFIIASRYGDFVSMVLENTFQAFLQYFLQYLFVVFMLIKAHNTQ